jgi:HSP20 family molecular chaperone IbpA
MSLIPHSFFPRSMFDMDFWHRPESLGLGPSTLDLFDPFDELDHTIGRNLSWIDRPDYLSSFIPHEPRVPHRYRIVVDCAGYNPSSIKTKLSDDKRTVTVTGREGEERKGDEDYLLHEFKKTYQLPENVEADKMVSFMTSAGNLVIEMPVRREVSRLAFKDEGLPQIVDGENGQKQLQLSLAVPSNLDPAKIKVTCKDRDVIVQAEDKKETPDSTSQVYYYRRSTLPENTDFSSLKCSLENSKLSITAPVSAHPARVNGRQIPIQRNEQPKLK